MAVGTITVDLLARTGSFETDLNRAARTAEQRSRDIEASFTAANVAIAAGLGSLVAGAFSKAHTAIEALDKLDDASQKTGASVERLSQIQLTSVAFGHSFDEVDSAISRLAKGMATVDSDTNKTQKALAALGLSARDASGALRDPADLFVDIARRLQDFQDSAAKTALVTDLFGRSGANLLPVLNDMAAGVDTFKGTTAEAAAEAAAFNDRLNHMKAESQALAQAIIADVLPSLNQFLDYIKVVKSTSLTGFIFTSGDEEKAPGKRLQEINEQLASIAKQKADLDPSKGAGNKLNDLIFGDVGDLSRQEKALQNQRSYLLGLQQMQALANKSSGKDQVERSMAGPAVLNYTTGNEKKEAKGPKSQYEKDVEAARKLAKDLEAQVAEFGKGKAAVLDYKLALQGIPDALREHVVALRDQLDGLEKEKEFQKAVTDGLNKEAQALTKATDQIAQSLLTAEQVENHSYAERLQNLVDFGKTSAEAQAEANQLIEAEDARHALALAAIHEQQQKDKDAYAQASLQTDAAQLQGVQQFTDTLYGVLKDAGEQNSILGKTLFYASKAAQVAQIIVQAETAAAMTQAGLTAAAATTAALAGPAAPAVFAGLEANAITQGMIVRAIGYANAGLVAGIAIAGQRANGGPVEAGKQYIVGERGREAFIPSTNGMIVPNHALEGGAKGESITIVNNTRGRIDTAHVRQISETEKAIIIDEAITAVAGDLSNPNGRMSRAQQRNYQGLQRSRS